jgi:magnesium-transporting ATPase (P-type)
VKLVKEGVTPTPVTLAIGDGANDVSMIKEAHVGVGISGREGLQAANSADFSIAQFRFLKTLLFVHGRYDYRRLSKVILYSFYKNVVLVLTIFYYNFYTGFSGQPMYDDWLYSGFNLFLFASPIMLGIYDVDVSKETVFEIPQLYMSGRLQLDLNTNKMIETIALSVINSLVIMLFSSLSYPTLDDGINNGVYLFGTLVFSNLVFSMQYRCLFIGHTFNKNVIYGTIMSLFLLFLFFLLYGGVICLYMGDPATFYYMVPMHLMGQPIYWISLLGMFMLERFDVQTRTPSLSLSLSHLLTHTYTHSL